MSGETLGRLPLRLPTVPGDHDVPAERCNQAAVGNPVAIVCRVQPSGHTKVQPRARLGAMAVDRRAG